MALTMTRTRTQTALTRLVKALAGINGELALVDSLLQRHEVGGATWATYEQRRLKLNADQEALCATICQFDAALDPNIIGSIPWRSLRSKRSGAAKQLPRLSQN
ncbi:MAG: hypothetical protein V4508_19095 [Pseudomonadota bacterium]